MKDRLLQLVLSSPIVLIVSTIGCTSGIKPSLTFNLTPSQRVELALSTRHHPVELTGTETATVYTNKGHFIFELYSFKAPKTVRNFIRLVEAGFYDGLIFHRYVGGFVIQGGDPEGTGMGNAGYTIEFEDSGMSHVDGAVGQARGATKNSGSCQFYVCLDDWPKLDGRYCIFGQVTDGLNVVHRLLAQDTILQIKIDR